MTHSELSHKVGLIYSRFSAKKYFATAKLNFEYRYFVYSDSCAWIYFSGLYFIYAVLEKNKNLALYDYVDMYTTRVSRRANPSDSAMLFFIIKNEP